jgi:hypothetical protein
MEDESTRPGREDDTGTSRTTPPVDADDAADGPATADDEFEWVDDGDWDPPNVEQRASDDAQAVSVGYVDMDEIIEPGDVSVENALFVALGVLGTVGLLFYIVQLAG